MGSIGGGSWSARLGQDPMDAIPPYSPRAWADVMRGLAVTYAKITAALLEEWAWPFARNNFGYDISTIAGSGSATFLAADGGSLQITSGATANSDELLANQDFQVSSILNKKWFVASRAQIITATDANARVQVCGICNGGVPTNYVALEVVNSQLILRTTNGTPTDVVTSWTVDTTVAHDFAIGFDGTTITALVDGVVVGTNTTLTNMPNATGYWACRTRNGATAAIRTEVVYNGYLAMQEP